MGVQKPGAEAVSDQPSDAGLPPKRLDSWKEIAVYFKRDIRTVQRWEKSESLPVHRHMHGEQGSVYAYRAELDTWWNNGRHRFSPAEDAVAVPELGPDLSDVAAAAEELPATLAPEPAETPSKSRRLRRPAARFVSVVAGLAFLLVVGALAFVLRPRVPPLKVLAYTQISHDGRAKLYGDVGAIVSDGSRLFYNGRWPQGGLFSVKATGGETVSIPVSFRTPFFSDISPDGADFLICHSSGCDVVPVVGGSPRHLGDSLSDCEGWSAVTQNLLCVSGSDIFIVKADGTGSRKLVTAPAGGEPSWPRMSPDGRVVRFSVFDEKIGNSLWEVAADGTNLHPLLPGWNPRHEDCCGSWTPDGKYYVFQSSADFTSPTRGGSVQVWAIGEKSSLFERADRKPFRLTSGPMDFYGPSLSKDGKRLFVVGALHHVSFSRYDAGSRQFVPFLSNIPAGGMGMDFSSDGNWVVYRSLATATLWRSRVDGSQRLQLTASPLEAALPRWSPDGRRIAFSGRTAGQPWKIYVIPSEGGIAQPVLPEERNQNDASWSPDGNFLAFGRQWDDGEAGKGGIHIVNLKTRQVRTLPDSGRLFSPRWSPNGRYIVALEAFMSGKPRLFDLEANKWIDLPKSAVGAFPSWTPDSKYIYSAQMEEQDFVRVRVSDHSVEQVASFMGLRPAINAHSGPWWGLAPGNTPYLLREVADEEIYALDLEAP